jgi:uncharacterized protein
MSKRDGTFLIYVVTFHGAWAFWPYVLYPKVAAIGAATLAYALVNIGIRLAVWVVPVWLYVRFVDGAEPLEYLRLRQHKRRGVVIGIIVTALNLVGSLTRFGLPHLSMQRVSWNSILGTSTMVGFIEEIPYRGFILQKIAERTNFWIANLITSLLFLAIHVPGWLALNTLRADTAATIFVFGFVMGVVFKYAGSLWAPIIAHSTNDFLSFVIFQL